MQCKTNSTNLGRTLNRGKSIKQRLSFNPWVVVFLGTAIFHTLRGSWEDILIFGGASLFILSQVFSFTKFGFKSQPKLGIPAIAGFVVLAAAVLYLAPRHSIPNLVLLLAIIPIGAVLLLYVDEENQPGPSDQVVRARWLWGSWAVVFALIELIAYVGSKLTQDLVQFPTISVLLDPVLETPLGRAVFVAFWLAAGVYLFGVRRSR